VARPKCAGENGALMSIFRLRTRLSLALLLAANIVVVSCCFQQRVVHSQSGRGFGNVFDGFVYVGMDVNRDSHDACGLEMPARFVSGHDYVFHHARPFDPHLEFARTVVPQRLADLGFAMTKAVDAPQGPVSFSSGILWFVQFGRERCGGSLKGQPCLDLTKRRLFTNTRWEETDYVLHLQGNCNE